MPRSSVWYISKYVAPPSGTAAGSRGYELMKELAKCGVTCTVITSDSNHLSDDLPKLRQPVTVEQRDRLQLCWLRTLKSSESKSVMRVAAWLHFEWMLSRLDKNRLPRPDAVIVSSPSLLTIINGFLIRRRFRARLVFEVRDIWPLTLTAEGGFSPRNPLIILLSLLERTAYRRSDVTVGTMPNLAEHVARVVGRAMPVACIPMGFAPQALDAVTPEEGDSADAAPSDTLTVGYAGTIGITNALAPFFEAASRLQSDPRFDFVVVGDGGLMQRYRATYGSLPNLRFVGRIPKPEVQRVLNGFDVLYLSTHPSEVWRYGQSLNKLIDYMLAAKPIVASYSGFPSMVDEAGCGTFVPSGDVDALVRVFQHYASMSAAERRRMGEAGRRWLLERRDYPRLARRYLRVLFGDDAQCEET